MQTWAAEWAAGDGPRRLALLYLANDILQNSRRKAGGGVWCARVVGTSAGVEAVPSCLPRPCPHPIPPSHHPPQGPEFVDQFLHVLPPLLAALVASGDADAARAVGRLLKIWEERRVFGAMGSRAFRGVLEGGSGGAGTGPRPPDPGHGAHPAKRTKAGDPLDTVRAALQAVSEATATVKTLEVAASDALSGEVSPGRAPASLDDVAALSDALKTEAAARERAAAVMRSLADAQEAKLGAVRALQQACAVAAARLGAGNGSGTAGAGADTAASGAAASGDCPPSTVSPIAPPALAGEDLYSPRASPEGDAGRA